MNCRKAFYRINLISLSTIVLVIVMWSIVLHPAKAEYPLFYTGMNYDTADGPKFEDIPPGYWAEDAINKILYAGITKGCSQNPLLYCPNSSVTRAQMAVFLGRGIHGSSFTPPNASGIFSDVPKTYWAAAWIEQFYKDGITGGCGTNPLRYCPENPVTRAQMAIFLLRAKHGKNYTPPPAEGIFNDVPVTYWAADWIEQLSEEGITSGCSTNLPQYCPESSVTRAQMAVFIVRTFSDENIDIVSSYVQYRSYNDPFPWPSDSRYRGYIQFRNDQPIIESDIKDIALKDQNQNEVIIDHFGFDKDTYYFGAWNETTQQVNFSGPYSYTGFGIHFPEETDLTSGYYTYEATTRFGKKLTANHYFPGKLELPIVNSATMVSEWIGGDLKLTWTNPDPNGPHDQVRVWLLYEDDDLKLPLMIRLPKTADKVTIPEQWVDNVKLLSGTNAMNWMVLLYAYDVTAAANMYARSFSDPINIQGWNN